MIIEFGRDGSREPMQVVDWPTVPAPGDLVELGGEFWLVRSRAFINRVSASQEHPISYTFHVKVWLDPSYSF
jgi:hypothetical protein